MTLVY